MRRYAFTTMSFSYATASLILRHASKILSMLDRKEDRYQQLHLPPWRRESWKTVIWRWVRRVYIVLFCVAFFWGCWWVGVKILVLGAKVVGLVAWLVEQVRNTGDIFVGLLTGSYEAVVTFISQAVKSAAQFFSRLRIMSFSGTIGVR